MIWLSTSTGRNRDVLLDRFLQLQLFVFQLFQDLAANAFFLLVIGLDARGGEEQRHALAHFIFGDRNVVDGGGNAVAVGIVGFGQGSAPVCRLWALGASAALFCAGLAAAGAGDLAAAGAGVAAGVAGARTVGAAAGAGWAPGGSASAAGAASALGGGSTAARFCCCAHAPDPTHKAAMPNNAM